jgi:hypothetical protein
VEAFVLQARSAAVRLEERHTLLVHDSHSGRRVELLASGVKQAWHLRRSRLEGGRCVQVHRLRWRARMPAARVPCVMHVARARHALVEREGVGRRLRDRESDYAEGEEHVGRGFQRRGIIIDCSAAVGLVATSAYFTYRCQGWCYGHKRIGYLFSGREW